MIYLGHDGWSWTGNQDVTRRGRFGSTPSLAGSRSEARNLLGACPNNAVPVGLRIG